MAEPKTRLTGASVSEFISAVPDEARRRDCQTLDRIMRRVSGKKPRMWGTSIVGYDAWTLTYADGRTLDWPILSFSPRKQALTLYFCGLSNHADLLKRLGKHKRSSQGCLYLTRLEGVDLGALEKLCERTYAEFAEKRGTERRSLQSARRAR